MEIGNNYSVLKTVAATVEAPAVVIIGGSILSQVFGWDQAVGQVVAGSVYGLFNGIINFIKNRKK